MQSCVPVTFSVVVTAVVGDEMGANVDVAIGYILYQLFN